VEGAGGFEVPLGPDWGLGELAADLGLPVLLVVGLRLGCLNHALLTAQAVRARGLRLAAWVGVPVDPAFAAREGNLQTLRQRLAPVPELVLPVLTGLEPGPLAAALEPLVSRLEAGPLARKPL